jgi:hypothetical protein
MTSLVGSAVAASSIETMRGKSGVCQRALPAAVASSTSTSFPLFTSKMYP